MAQIRPPHGGEAVGQPCPAGPLPVWIRSVAVPLTPCGQHQPTLSLSKQVWINFQPPFYQNALELCLSNLRCSDSRVWSCFLISLFILGSPTPPKSPEMPPFSFTN